MKQVCTICDSTENLPTGKEKQDEYQSLYSCFNELRSTEAIEENLRRAAQRQFNFDRGDIYKIKSKVTSLEKEIEARRMNIKNLRGEVEALEKRCAAIDVTEMMDAKRKMEEENEIELIVGEEMNRTLKKKAQILYQHRLRQADKVFRMMAVRVEGAHLKGKSNSSTRGVRGISTIFSLPLPNNGIFWGVPVDVLDAAMSYIAQLVDSVAAAMNIPLPHAISPFSAGDCLIHPQYNAQLSFSLSPAIYIGDRSTYHDFCWKTLRELQLEEKATSSKVAASPENHHSEYVMNESFLEAVTLLQADVVALCIMMGLEGKSLWPPQSLLLNLNDLHKHILNLMEDFDAVEYPSLREERRLLRQLRSSMQNQSYDKQPNYDDQDEDDPLQSMFDQLYEYEMLKSLIDRHGNATKVMNKARLRLHSLINERGMTSSTPLQRGVGHFSSDNLRISSFNSSPRSQVEYIAPDDGNVDQNDKDLPSTGTQFLSIEGSYEEGGDEWDIVSICSSRI